MKRSAIVVAALVAGAASLTSQTRPANVRIIAHVIEPAKLPVSADMGQPTQRPVIYASGLRKTIGFSAASDDPRALGIDHGIDCWAIRSLGKS